MGVILHKSTYEINVCVCTYIDVSTYVRMYVCMYACMYVCMYVCIHDDICMYIHMYCTHARYL